MTRFGKKSLIWLVAGSFVAAGGAAVWRVTATGAKQAQDALQQVAKSEADLVRLKASVEQWGKIYPPGSIAAQGALRIEPVALTADFSQREFPELGQVLAGMYTEHGSLNLKSFNLEVVAGGKTHVALLGDKVFVQ